MHINQKNNRKGQGKGEKGKRGKGGKGYQLPPRLPQEQQNGEFTHQSCGMYKLLLFSMHEGFYIVLHLSYVLFIFALYFYFRRTSALSASYHKINPYALSPLLSLCLFFSSILFSTSAGEGNPPPPCRAPGRLSLGQRCRRCRKRLPFLSP